VRRAPRPSLDLVARCGFGGFADSTRTSGNTWRARGVDVSAVCARVAVLDPAVIAQASATLSPQLEARSRLRADSRVNAR
jgi:hypothetical protein